MKTIIVGIGGMTNGGKSTLATRLHQQIASSCLIAQDAYFKEDSKVPVDSNGFKQYDDLVLPACAHGDKLDAIAFNIPGKAIESPWRQAVLDALYMEKMMDHIESWKRDPENFMKQKGLRTTQESSPESQVFVLIVEGFLIFNYRPINYLYNKKYFMEIPYNICKKRRSSRVYIPPDPPGYFDGHVWPMYLKNRKEMEAMTSDIVFIDGLQEKEQLLDSVYKDVKEIIEELREKE